MYREGGNTRKRNGPKYRKGDSMKVTRVEHQGSVLTIDFDAKESDKYPVPTEILTAIAPDVLDAFPRDVLRGFLPAPKAMLDRAFEYRIQSLIDDLNKLGRILGGQQELGIALAIQKIRKHFPAPEDTP